MDQTSHVSNSENQQTSYPISIEDVPEIVVQQTSQIFEDAVSSGESESEQKTTPPASLSVKFATILNFRYISLDGSSKRIVQYQVELKLANNETHKVWKRFNAFR